MSITKELTDFVVRVSFDELPEKVVHQTKKVILDTLGCAIAGYGTNNAWTALERSRNDE